MDGLDEIALAAVVLCWSTIAVVWVGGAIYGLGWNRPDRATAAARVPLRITLGAIVAAACVAIAGQMASGWLRIDAAWARVAGLGLLVAATAFALWARRELGTSWTVRPMVTGDHRLRTTGPYGITRHPIYTGILGMLIGTSLVVGGGPALAAPAIGLLAVAVKIRSEEPLLLAMFPETYARYRDTVPALVPGLRLLGPPRGPGKARPT
jgi:protein-S-isoprenylcysteine O-methyltransferase Ste14